MGGAVEIGVLGMCEGTYRQHRSAPRLLHTGGSLDFPSGGANKRRAALHGELSFFPSPIQQEENHPLWELHCQLKQ